MAYSVGSGFGADPNPDWRRILPSMLVKDRQRRVVIFQEGIVLNRLVKVYWMARGYRVEGLNEY